MGHIKGLDTVRAVAVLMVIISHFGVGAGYIDGGMGVQIFFVLSGFLITSLLLKEQAGAGAIDTRAFYVRRAARILPAFFGYTAVVIAYCALRSEAVAWPEVLASSIYVMNYYEALASPPNSYFSHCWSLSVEEQFYIVWPLAFVFFHRRGQLSEFLIVSVITLWGIRAVEYFAFAAPDAYMYRALENRADNLLAGCLLAVLAQKEALWRGARWCTRTVVIPLALCAALLYISRHNSVRPFRYTVGFTATPVIIAMLLPQIITAASGSGWVTAVLNWQPLVYLGKISYGMYLFHILPQSPVKTITPGLDIHLQLLLQIAIVTAMAAASFHVWEAPLRAFIVARWKWRQEGKLATPGAVGSPFPP